MAVLGGGRGLAETLGESAAPPAKEVPVIGIQIGAISFLDEGTEKVLDILQEKGGVNTLFVASFTYGNGTASRMIQGHPLPDHGVQKYDEDFHGGNYATPHPQYYKDSILKNLKAPDHGNVDILEMIIPACKKRGIKVYTWTEDVFSPTIPNIEKVNERDLYGRPAHTVCFNNPDVHNFWTGLHKDFTRSYDIDGVMWGSERYGPFGNMVESVHNRKGNDPSRVTCFCEFCQAKAKARGIDVKRAFDGYHMLEKWRQPAAVGNGPRMGTTSRCGESSLSIPRSWRGRRCGMTAAHETYAAIYEKVKSIKPQNLVGWHVWHAHSFSPFFRAQTDLAEISKYSDYLKMTVYHNLGGTRMETYITSTSNTIYGDMPIEEALESISNDRYGCGNSRLLWTAIRLERGKSDWDRPGRPDLRWTASGFFLARKQQGAELQSVRTRKISYYR